MNPILCRLAGACVAASLLVVAPGCSSPATGSGLSISDSSARGCEVLLTEGTAKVDKVTFDDSVAGSYVREAPRVAISFVSAKDAAIAQGAVKLTVVGDATQVQVKKVSCVGAKAAPLSGVSVTLE